MVVFLSGSECHSKFMKRLRCWSICSLACGVWLMTGYAVAAPATPVTPKLQVDTAGFDAKVKPILSKTCSGCHNSSVTSGDVNLLPYLDPATVLTERAAWEKIAQKI